MNHKLERLKFDINKWLDKINYIDLQITRNLKDAGYETRPVNCNGLWCPFLLPFILLLYTWTGNVTTAYKITAFVSLGLLSYSILFTAFMTISCIVIKEPIYGGCTASGFISVLLIYTFAGQGLLFSLCIALSSTFLYSHLLRYAINDFPKTFTIGEAMVVLQGVVLYIACAVSILVAEKNYDEETKFINIIVYVEYIILGTTITALSCLNSNQKTLSTIITLSGSILIIMLFWAFGPSSIPKHFYNLLNHAIHRIKLITLWLILVVFATMALIVHTKYNTKANTVTRKLFHLLASMVFLCGIITDLALMNLAAGVGFGLLILIEAIRKSKIQPVADMLQSAFLVYSDEKDCGGFAMTPIYLYVGLACPLLLVPHSKVFTLELLSGVLSIGIGDSAASYFGSKYGGIKWPGTDRTVEGTAGNIISQMAMIYALDVFGYLHAKRPLLRSLVATTITSLVEAQTEQVDNLILPLVTLITYRLTGFMQ